MTPLMSEEVQMDTAAVDTINEQDSPPPGEPTPTDGLTDTVRVMRDELAAHYKGANPPSIDKAIEAVQPGSANPRSWDSRGMAGKAVKAYRDSIGGTPAKTPTVRTAAAKPRRTVVRRPDPEPVRTAPEPTSVPPPVAPVHPVPVPQPQPAVRTAPGSRPVVWPVMLLAAPAFVAIWGGWVGLGGLTGFGKVNLLPGIGGGFTIDSAITLPIGVETYGAYALYVWLSGRVSERTLKFARTSAVTSLLVGALGQVAYHLLVAAGVKSAPWWITTLVACLPVAVLGMGAALAHLVREES